MPVTDLLKERAVATKIPECDPVNGDVTLGGPKFDPPAQQLRAARLQIFRSAFAIGLSLTQALPKGPTYCQQSAS